MAEVNAVLILNPLSGSSPLASGQHPQEKNEEEILEILRSYGIEPEVRYTTEDDPGENIARQAAMGGADLVIAAGGDGTLHAVACGLTGTTCTLGIIPLGTMNNIARSLQIPEDLARACEIIATGKTGCIDVGVINGHIFLEVAGIGIEAALFPAAEEIKRTGFWSTLRGIFQGFATLWHFQSTRFVASFDGRRARRFRALQVSVCNSPYYGARLQFAPNAVMDDGFLDVLIYKNFSKFEFIKHGITISQGKRALEPRIKRFRVKRLYIQTAEPVPIHTDGEQVGTSPALIEIRPGNLHVRVPLVVASGPNLRGPTQDQFRGKIQNTQVQERGSLYVQQ